MIPGSATPLLLAQAASDGPFSIERSLRFNAPDSSHLSRTPSSAGNRKTWTWSGWIKKSGQSANQFFFGAGPDDGGNTNQIQFFFMPNDKFRITTAQAVFRETTQVFRDPSSFFHLVVAFDTLQSTANDRIKIYINNSQVTDFSQTNNPAQNADTGVNSAADHRIGQGSGASYSGSSYAFNGYLAECILVDGAALDPTSFGAFDDNGVWQGIDTAGLSFGTNGFRLKFADNSSNAALGTDSSGNSNTWTVNNLTTAAALNPTAKQNFDVVTYTGNGAAGSRAVTGLSFKPDFVWLKGRSYSISHLLYDNVRGAGSTKSLVSNGSNSEGSAGDNSTFGYLESFDTNGFSIYGGSDVNNGYVNKNSATYVAWCWKAGGAASSNTDGTITSSCSVNASYGFSVVTWTGQGSGTANIGHGLSSAPKFIFVKALTGSVGWTVGHDSIGWTKRLKLNGNDVESTSSNYWNNTAPTSSVFTSGANNVNNTFVAYCWSEIAGFSKFGSYSGSGSSGQAITGLGFKPRFVLIKRTDTIENWHIFDSERGGTKSLFPDLANAEVTDGARSITFADDGFTLGTQGGINASGGTYIYAAFAATTGDAVGIDSLVDTPSNAAEPSDTGVGNEVVGNYCLMNPLDNGGLTLANGNLDVTMSTSAWRNCRATIGMTSGKWYFEVECKAATSGQGLMPGILNAAGSITTTVGANSGGYAYNAAGGNKYNNNVGSSYGAAFDNGDIIGVAYDGDNGTITFYKNGASQGVAFTSIPSGTYFPAVAMTGTMSASINFGQRAFAHPLSSNPIYSQSVSGAVAGSPYDATKMFDGSLTTYADHNAQNSTITWTYTLTSVTSLRVYIHEGSSTGTVTTVGGNGTQTDTISANFGPGWHTISLSSTGSTINSIAFTRGGSGNPLEIYAIEVNGTVLVEGAGAIYKSLNTANLPTPTIADGSKYFDTKLWTGDGASTRTISNYGFSPDFIWVKNRSLTGWGHRLYDQIRGAGTGSVVKSLSSDDTRSESSGNDTNHGYLSGYTSDGFNLVKGSQSGGDYFNHNGNAYVGWGWDGGTSTVTNNDGSIASQVRAQPSAGFSIIKAPISSSGGTIGTALNASPGMLIVKNIGTSGTNWVVWHSSLGTNDYLLLNSTAAKATSSNLFNGVSNSTFTVGSGFASSTPDFICYAFAPVANYSHMGSFLGNANSDGPFVALSFRPAFILIKNASLAGSNWIIIDTSRDTYNESDHLLKPNKADAEQVTTANEVDILSNGFKLRGTDGDTNGSGNTMIYYAVAENPFQANGGLAR